ncbi:MAG: hypothetical protein R3F59_07550 [Myxococcota bacterium]
MLWMPGSASAVEWYLESPDVAARADAARIEEIATQGGFEARVVRRFVDGAGWRYLPRVEGFADAPSAGAAADALAQQASVVLAVLQLDGERVLRIGEARPPGAAPPDVEAADEDPEPLLAQIAHAHGTGADTLAALAAQPVLLRYRRILPDGRVVRHVWASSGGRSRVEIVPEGGAAGIRPSVTVAVPGKAWLSVDGGPFAPQDPEKARLAIAALGPQELLPLVLAVGQAFEERGEFARMALVAPDTLRYGGDSTTGAIALHLDREHRIRGIELDDGAVARQLDDYRPLQGVAGAVVPFRIATARGDRVDRVELEAFEVGAELPESWFAPQEGGRP